MLRNFCAVAACAALIGCAETGTVERSSFIERMLPPSLGTGESTTAQRRQGRITGGRVATAGEGTIFPGRVPLVRDSDFRDANGDQTVSLTLVDVSIADAAAAILGELLGENYIVDPNVSGTVNIQSAQPISRAIAIEVFELALKQNGAALIKRDDIFAVVPLTADLNVGASTARDVPPGYNLRIVPLRNIGAQEMAAILQPFAGSGIVGVDAQRNIIVLAGNSSDQRAWQKTINSFDVDWMSNRSVGMFPIRGRSAQSIVNGLERIVQTDEEFEPIAAFEVIPENNSILVVAKTPRALESMATWIKRLTREGQNDAQIYSYDMKFARASEVAPTLSSILGIEVKAAAEDVNAEAVLEAEVMAASDQAGTENAVRVVASEATNTLLIHAPDTEYKRILGVLHRLDVPPRQVLVEATIVEVTLTDELRYGVQYFFDNSDGDTIGLTRSTTSTSISPQVPGFSLTLDAGPEVVIDALEGQTEINVVSSPNLMILNNESARLLVGDRVPVATQQATDTSENNNVFVSTVEFQDTGVIFDVTPRINSSGAVTLDITQEVSSIGPTDADTLTPTISQRIIDSSVSVDSGETIVLGGLFSARESKDNSGIPVLKNLPVAGKLFGATSRNENRTELLVLITPRIVNNAIDARRVTEQLSARVRALGSGQASLSTQLDVPTLGTRGLDDIPLVRTPQAAAPAAPAPELETEAALQTENTVTRAASALQGNYAMLGSFRLPGGSKRMWKKVTRDTPEAVAGMTPVYGTTSSGLHTLAVGPLEATAARDVCIKVRVDCYVSSQ